MRAAVPSPRSFRWSSAVLATRPTALPFFLVFEQQMGGRHENLDLRLALETLPFARLVVASPVLVTPMLLAWTSLVLTFAIVLVARVSLHRRSLVLSRRVPSIATVPRLVGRAALALFRDRRAGCGRSLEL